MTKNKNNLRKLKRNKSKFNLFKYINAFLEK